jgi:hypothetical protein
VKRARKKRRNSWILRHDSAPCDTSLAVSHFTLKNHIPAITRPPCSSDLAPCDFWLFLRPKKRLRGHHFASVEEFQQIATAGVRGMPEEDFRRFFHQWKDAWSKCVRAEGHGTWRVTWLLLLSFGISVFLKITAEFLELHDPSMYVRLEGVTERCRQT